MSKRSFCLCFCICLIQFVFAQGISIQKINGKNVAHFNEVELIKEFKAAGGTDDGIEHYLYEKRIEFFKLMEDNTPKKNNSVYEITSPAQVLGACDNVDFETGGFSRWTADTSQTLVGSNTFGPGGYFYENWALVQPHPRLQPTVLPSPGRIQIKTPADKDLCTNQPVVAPGSGSAYSVMLGDTLIKGKIEQLYYTFTVTPSNTSFCYRYMVVMQHPVHTPAMSAYFEFKVYEQGKQYPDNPVDCSLQHIYAGQQNVGWVTVPGVINQQCLKNYYGGSACNLGYIPWTSRCVDLTAQLGKTVTAVFTNSDCGEFGHFGYSYIDPFCATSTDTVIKKSICGGGSVLLQAPSGHGPRPPYTTGTGSGVSYQWQPGGQNTASITVGTAGTYTATTTVMNDPKSVSAGSCVYKTIYQVTVEPKPTPNFTSVPNCNKQVVFTDGSTTNPGTISSWKWTFGDGSSSTIQNPSHTYNTAGTFTVNLVVNSSGGCVDSIKKTVTIPNPPTADFTPTTVCANTPTNFTDISVGTPNQWSWNFGDPGSGASNNSTIKNPSHTYSSAGAYTVTLIIGDANACADTVVKQVNVLTNTTADFNASPVCAGQVTNFTDASSSGVNQWSWNFGDAGSTATTQNPTHTYAAPGTYTVTLTTSLSGGCQDTKTKTVTINPTPVPDFTPTGACLGGPATFVNNSNVSSGTIASYSWNFGEPASGANNTSTLQTPTHTYATAGTFTITLATTSSGGCVDSVKKTVVINPLPVGDFTPTTVCSNTPTNFTDISTGNPTQWSWNFGDPGSGASNTSTIKNPSHTYATAGSFTVNLIVTTAAGCVDTVTKQVTVLSLGLADFSSSPVCASKPTDFKDASNPGTNVWSWDFGDGNNASIQNPSHTYAAAGTYTVTLISSISGGCIDTMIKAVTINPTPVPVFTTNNVCLNNATPINNTSSIANPGTISNYDWDFGEPSSGANNTSTAQTPSHTFGSAGTFTISLIVTSNNGCKDTLLKPVDIYPLPNAGFTAPVVCVGSATQYTDTSKVSGGGSIVGWNWNFGEPVSGANNLSTQSNPTHTYATAGTFTVLLTVTTDRGCQSSTSQTVTVSPIPVADFSPTSVCEGVPTKFTDLSTGTPTAWEWDFGDGSGVDNGSSPNHTYTTTGNYTVTLVVYAGTCTDTIQKAVTVYPPAKADYTSTNICVGGANTFMDNSSAGGNTITTWDWNFGDNTNPHGTSNNPSHAYATAGTYSVTLIATSVNGCKDSITKPVDVYPKPQSIFEVTSVCLNSTTQTTDLSGVAGGGVITNWSWDFGDGSAVATTQKPTHVYNAVGDYTVTLIVTSDHGCLDTMDMKTTVYPIPVVSMLANDTDGCAPLCVQFTDATAGTISSWSWSFSDNGSSTQQNPNHCFNDPGLYSVSLTVTSSNGCTASGSKPNWIIVYPNPVADFEATPMVTSILDPKIQVTDYSSGADKICWNFGDGTSICPGAVTQNHTYPEDVTGMFTITDSVYTTHGCWDTAHRVIEIKPEWTFYVPNCITPNGDGRNDMFFGTGIGITQKEMWIFDRWGNLIFHTNDLYGGWDGKVQDGPSNEIAQEDVYVWLIEIVEVFGKKHRYVGHVSIVK